LIEINIPARRKASIRDGQTGRTAVSNCLARASDFILSPTGDPGWLLIEDGVNPVRERQIKALFALSNGYFGMRASVAEGTRFSHPSTLVGGVFVAAGCINAMHLKDRLRDI
jgi:hypothetical protein